MTHTPNAKGEVLAISSFDFQALEFYARSLGETVPNFILAGLGFVATIGTIITENERLPGLTLGLIDCKSNEVEIINIPEFIRKQLHRRKNARAEEHRSGIVIENEYKKFVVPDRLLDPISVASNYFSVDKKPLIGVGLSMRPALIKRQEAGRSLGFAFGDSDWRKITLRTYSIE
jgi:hypothetical protein